MDLNEMLKESLQHLVGLNESDYGPLFWRWKNSFSLGRKIEMNVVMSGETPGIPLILFPMTRSR